MVTGASDNELRCLWRHLGCILPARAPTVNRSFSAAGFWDYANVFVTTFFANGLAEFSQWVQTGHLARSDQLIAVPAWFSNFLLIIGCLWAYARLPAKRALDVARLVLAFLMTSAFFAADMALFEPRYLSVICRALHPHLPWRTGGYKSPFNFVLRDIDRILSV